MKADLLVTGRIATLVGDAGYGSPRWRRAS
jgi:hypothetical protein